MCKNMIYVPLEDFEEKCKAQAELDIMKRYLEANNKYGSFDEFRQILGMEFKNDDTRQ